MDVAGLAAVSGVNLHMIGDDPVAHPELEEGIPFILAVGFGNQIETFGGLYFAADAPGQAVFMVFAFAGVAPRLVWMTNRSSAKEALAGK